MTAARGHPDVDAAEDVAVHPAPRGLRAVPRSGSVVPERGRSQREHIALQISGVLDPLAVRLRGWPVEVIRPLVARAWRREFGGGLSEIALADTAAALRDGRPWSEALWTAGW